MSIDKQTGIIRSKFEDVPVPDIFVHEFIEQNIFASCDPDKLFETEFATGVSSTYGWVQDRNTRITSWLLAQGVGKGDQIAFFSSNLIEYFPSLLAVLKVGAAFTYIRPEMITDENFRNKIGLPKFIFACGKRVQQLLDSGFTNIVVYRSEDSLPEKCYHFEEIIKRSPPSTPLPRIKIPGNSADTLAAVTFTGGTTGYPKPIQITHRALVSVMISSSEWRELLPVDKSSQPTIICALPTVHLAGPMTRLAMIERHPHIILLEPSSSPTEIFGAIQTHRVQLMAMVSGKLIEMSRSPELKSYDLSSMENCVCSGGPITAEIQEDLRSKLGFKCLYKMFAMSECAGYVMNPTAVPGAMGSLARNVQAMVKSVEDGSPITEPGQIGELYLRCPHRTIGYLGLPEKTAEVISADGFLKTADLVKFDEDFNFYYIDRLQEVVTSKSGRMISSTILELRILFANESVQLASVISSPNGPRAVVVPVVWPADEGAFIEEVIKKSNESILEDDEKLTGGVVLMRGEDVPRSVLGKALKRNMRHL